VNSPQSIIFELRIPSFQRVPVWIRDSKKLVKKLFVDENGPPCAGRSCLPSSSSKIHTHSTKPKVGTFCYFTKKNYLLAGSGGAPIQNYCSDTTPIKITDYLISFGRGDIMKKEEISSKEYPPT
jgi:hypothetical protein